eukprot:4447550-Lingulodinium_polyedra.AAC.1
MLLAVEVVDDVGVSWSFVADRPAAIVDVCRQSVRRLLLERVARAFPHLPPSQCDVAAPDQGNT